MEISSFLLINCEVELSLAWSRGCEISRLLNNVEVPAYPNANLPVWHFAEGRTTVSTFKINSENFYVPVINLLINDDNKFLKYMKQRLKRNSWKKYRSEITKPPKSNNLDYMIDPTFSNINSLFVFSFENGRKNAMRDSSDKYYLLLVEIKDFQGLIKKQFLLNRPVKNKLEAYEKLVEMLWNDLYATGGLLDYL